MLQIKLYQTWKTRELIMLKPRLKEMKRMPFLQKSSLCSRNKQLHGLEDEIHHFIFNINMNSFIQCFIQQAIKMSISETYAQKIPNIFEINTLLMITFIMLFVWRIITLKTKTFTNPLKILGIATLKLIHYVSSLYSLIMFSFLM